MGIQTPKLDPLPIRLKSKGLLIAANHPFRVADGFFYSLFASTVVENFKYPDS